MQKTLTHRQLVFVLFIVIITVSVTNVSKTQALAAGHGAWVPLLLTGLIFGSMATVIVRLGRMYEGDTLFEYSAKIAGKFTAYLLAVVFYFYFQLFSTYYCYTFFDMIKTNFLPKSPTWLLLLVSMPFLGFIAYKGLTNAGRLAELLGIIFLAVSVLLYVTMLIQGRLEYLLPLYIRSETGRYISAAKNTVDQFIGIALLTLIPVGKADRTMPKVVFFTLVGIAVFYILNVYGCYAMIGLDEIKHYNYPLIDALRLVEYKKIEFFQRVDITYQTIGFMRVIAAKGIVYLCAVEYLCKLFSKARRIAIVVAVGVLFYIVDMISLGIPDIQVKLFTIRTVTALVTCLFIPSALFVLAKVKQRGKKNG